ncbi:MAG: hypothetical protein OHK0013_11890 [Sandaracinaceae bacterium]
MGDRVWSGAQVCVRGRAHELDGSGCDDRARIARSDGLAVAALADGCGSARLGGLGARWAVEEACAAVLRTSRVDLVEVAKDAVRAASEYVRAQAADLELHTSDCTSTLTLAIARGDELVLAHVGDGVIVGRDLEGWRVLSHPLGGEHANETFVLTDPMVLEHARIQRLVGVTACALLTDGAASSLWERRSDRVAPALEKVARALGCTPEHEVERALRTGLGAQLRARTTDDCGLVVLATHVDVSTPVRSSSPVEEARCAISVLS